MSISDLAVGLLRRIPKNTVSRAFGAVSDVEFPSPLQQAVNHSFVALAGIDAEEAEAPPGDYETLNDYFTRHLRDGARTVEADGADDVISPVDGTLGAFGAIEEGMLFQAKGRQYPLLELVDSADDARRFDGGHYATIYLSPRDYHRIHSPVKGDVVRASYIPGHLFPVNPFAVENIDELFAVNERLITHLETAKGWVGVCKVGATCVGKIGLAYDGFHTNGRLRRRREFEPEEQVEFAHGDELAVFNLGSTVIVLIEEPGFEFDDALETGTSLKMGQTIGALGA